MCADRHSVIAVGEVDLGHLWGTIIGVGISQSLQEALETCAKLHGSLWCECYSALVDCVVRVVHDGPWSTVPLWDDPRGRDS